MIGDFLRPWGRLTWLLPKLPQIKWDLLACLSTEDRFNSAFNILQAKEKLNSSRFYKIIDPASQDSVIIAEKLQTNGSYINGCSLEEHQLLEPSHRIVDSVNNFIKDCTGNVILDISTFPKRFFFPIIKLLLKQKLNNLIVAYSTPKAYCQGDLSGNPYPWDHLPLFMPVEVPESPVDVAIVGVGFMPFGLPDLLLSRYSSITVKFLFPFPPGPPNYQRTWDFMRKIQKSFTFKPSDNIIRLDSSNMPDAYQYIVKASDNGDKKCLFAPYGPKPISLAMCIYATLNESAVYYTQPTYYSPEYSTGVKDVFGYSIIINNKLLY